MLLFPLINDTSASFPPEADWTQIPITTVTLYLIATCHYVILLISMRKILKTSSFYRIFHVSGVTNILHCFGIIWIAISDECVRGPLFSPFIRFFHVWNYSFYCSSAFICVLQCANRLCGTFLWYPKYWSNRFTYGYLTIIFLLSISESIPYMIVRRTYYVDGTQWKYWNSYNYDFYKKPLDVLVIGSTELASFVLICWTYYRLKKEKRRIGNLEVNLLLVAVIHGLINFSIFAGELNSIFRDELSVVEFFRRNVKISFFINTVCDSFTIILTHKTIRKEYFDTLMFWKKTNGGKGPSTITPLFVAIGSVRETA